jgi:hypothetical protein
MSKTTSAALVLSLLAGLPAALAEKPAMEVRFELAEDHYRDYYAPAEREQLADAVESLVADVLSRHFGFLAFVAEPRPDVAVLRLGTAGDPSLRPIRLHLRLEGERVGTATDTVSWEFRPLTERWDEPGSRAALVEEIASSVERHLSRAAASLVEALFSKVRLAEQADPKPEWGGWVLPFTGPELRAEMEATKFRIRARVRRGPGEADERHEASFRYVIVESEDVPPELWRRVFAEVVSDHDLRAASELRAHGIYVLEYEPLPPEVLTSTTEFDEEAAP